MRRLIAVGIVLLTSMVGTHPAFAETDEGIQIHGHWKIEVLEPDGTPVSVTEFENAFIGDHFASFVLTGGYTVGLWGIELDATAGNGPCNDGSGDAACHILEPVDPHTDPDVFPNLEVTVHGGTHFGLAGSAVAAFSTSIDRVRTKASYCGSDVAPDSCLGTAIGGLSFTETILGAPVSVEPDQIIQVTVTISFS